MKYATLLIPLLLFLALVLSLIKKKDAFNAFSQGAREGLLLSKEIIPSIVGMIALVSIIKSCGIIEDISYYLSKVISNGKYFSTILPIAIIRPISGNASLALLNSTCKVGADSLECITASLIQGSTDTTFYVIALYFSSVKITQWRHTLKAALFADFVGITLAIVFALLIFK